MGQRGEKWAARFLQKHGYKVLYRQFRARGGGEVDLVCRHGDTLVFVEVKTRTSQEYGRPADAVGAEKQRLIARGAYAWLHLLPEEMVILYRFDIVEVIVGGDGEFRGEIVPDAFTPPDWVLR